MTALTAVLLCLTALALAPSLVQANGRVASCCLKTSNTKIRMVQLAKYYIQNRTAMCHVAAVVFTTVRGVTICSNPSDTWTKKGMKFLDGRRRTRPMATPDVNPTRSGTAEVTSLMLNTTDNSTDSAVTLPYVLDSHTLSTTLTPC
ncbi:hypothetical protein AAFF_G00206660 [Aldrovandia affinis]|uniref:C-C motif chemokine n=1 Tax=Aldrovandia affinis TaxID=143900 RepID=A0AAD7RHJ6_9TELE|nr:hypothetical protein AAFF_G00206660 [Aldrovandia affinis]